METIKEKERKREQKKQLVPVQYTVSTKDGRMMIDAKDGHGSNLNHILR